MTSTTFDLRCPDTRSWRYCLALLFPAALLGYSLTELGCQSPPVHELHYHFEGTVHSGQANLGSEPTLEVKLSRCLQNTEEARRSWSQRAETLVKLMSLGPPGGECWGVDLHSECNRAGQEVVRGLLRCGGAQ